MSQSGVRPSLSNLSSLSFLWMKWHMLHCHWGLSASLSSSSKKRFRQMSW